MRALISLSFPPKLLMMVDARAEFLGLTRSAYFQDLATHDLEQFLGDVDGLVPPPKAPQKRRARRKQKRIE